jgi:hypothetical protein
VEVKRHKYGALLPAFSAVVVFARKFHGRVSRTRPCNQTFPREVIEQGAPLLGPGLSDLSDQPNHVRFMGGFCCKTLGLGAQALLVAELSSGLQIF